LFFKAKKSVFDQIRLLHVLTKFGHRLRSNSNFKTKFDLEFEFRIRHFQSYSVPGRICFEIRLSLVKFDDDGKVLCSNQFQNLTHLATVHANVTPHHSYRLNNLIKKIIFSDNF
jgi:hypothetical protein